jgi:hypothetical protein
VARTIEDVAIDWRRRSRSSTALSLRAAVASCCARRRGSGAFIRRRAQAILVGPFRDPGGRIDPTDTGPRMAAERETRGARARPDGSRLLVSSPMSRAAESICVSAFVCARRRSVLKPNHKSGILVSLAI